VSILQPPWDKEEPDRSQPGEPYVPRKSARRSIQRLGQGALACPVCEVPVFLAAPVPFSGHLVCPFCLESRPARLFVRLDKFDTARNVVEVRARLPI
jgi:hypothetical protein